MSQPGYCMTKSTDCIQNFPGLLAYALVLSSSVQLCHTYALMYLSSQPIQVITNFITHKHWCIYHHNQFRLCFLKILLYVYDYFAFTYVCLCTPCVLGAYGSQIRASDHWELELVGHCHVGVVNQTQFSTKAAAFLSTEPSLQSQQVCFLTNK